MRLSYFFILFFFVVQHKLSAQQVLEKQPLNELAGYKYKHVAMNADSSGSGLPIIIGLHWSGSTPDEFAAYLDDFKIPARLILVQAPYPHKKGFSFFSRQPKDYYTLPADEKMVVLLSEGEKLSKFIEAITSLYKPSRKPIIIGASQGGDLSYVIGARYNHLISQACPLLATMDNRIIPSGNGQTQNFNPIDVFHGDADPIVKIDTSRQHVQALKQNNYKVNLHSYKDIKHDIPGEMEKDYIRLIEGVLGN
ncbi:alpha/beta hydrolase [Terrimonas alba]|uniref:alpha/beta hydrolase n=1 Tax=Terrimonas alba TaxID=3349636 RepID=UPI0035F4B7E1